MYQLVFFLGEININPLLEVLLLRKPFSVSANLRNLSLFLINCQNNLNNFCFGADTLGPSPRIFISMIAFHNIVCDSCLFPQEQKYS
jgi:hypothetical protein